MASMFLQFLILLGILVLLPLTSFGFECPGPIYPSHGLTYARIEPNIIGRASQEYSKIRIKLFHDPSIENKPYKELVQQAADFWANSLSVKPVDGRLFKSRDCELGNHTTYIALNGSEKMEKYCLGSCSNTTKCFHFQVPNEHLDGCKFCNEEGQNCSKSKYERGTGIQNADLVFYVTAVTTTPCLNVTGLVAYAGACDFEPVLDRPVFGVINICPKEATQYSNDDKLLLQFMKHEMMHPLGFGFGYFRLFRDKYGWPLWPRDDIGKPKDLKYFEQNEQHVLSKIPRDWHVRGIVLKSERLFLVTPNVVREARNHFGCLDLEGAELEDQGSTGTKYFHFEARVFHEEAMKGNLGAGKELFSRLSFAVLEDSGWYQVNYSQAEDMVFGKNLGCDFCKKSCKFWMDKSRMKDTSVKPFCESPDIENKRSFFCNGSKKLFSGCPLRKVPRNLLKMLHDPNSSENFIELPRMYQNFDKISGVSEKEVAAYGSIDPFADFCPIPIQNFDVRRLKDFNDKIECDKESKPAEEINPAEEFEDEEHQEGNQCSHLNCPVLLVSLFTFIIIII